MTFVRRFRIGVRNDAEDRALLNCRTDLPCHSILARRRKNVYFCAMKTVRLLFGAVLLTALLSCGRAKPGFCPPATPASGILASIDSLMGRQPDSAFVLLQEFTVSPEADSLDVFSRHYCQLMVSELLYKNDCGQSNRDAVLKARPYFDSLSEAFPKDPALALLSARAHYMKGVGYYERDSVTEACREYLQALEIMEGRFEEKELVGTKARFMALTYNRLANLFSDQLMLEPSIAFERQALSFCKKAPTSLYGVSKNLYHIGVYYDMQNNVDSAFFYYEQALDNLPDTSNLVHRDIVSSKAFLSYCLSKGTGSALSDLKRMLVKSESGGERLRRCLTISEIYFKEQALDSVLHYSEIVFKKSDDKLSKLQAASHLQYVYEKEGNALKSNEYTKFLSYYTLPEVIQNKNNATLTRLIQKNENRKLNLIRLREKKKSNRHAVFVFSVLTMFLIALIVLPLSLKHRSRLKKAETQMRSLDIQHAAHVAKLKKQTHF